MQYTVYKTINLVNGKIYIGMHKTKNPNDDYLGSGMLLKKAIKKYKRKNFVKEVLFVYNNPTDMKKKESELVTEEFCLLESNYNLVSGGKGGFDYINRKGLNIIGFRDYESIAKKVSETKRKNPYVCTEETKQKISKNNQRTNKSRGEKVSKYLKGRKKSEEHKAKLSESIKNCNYDRKKQSENMKGKNNPCFGTCYVYNLTLKKSIRIKKNELNDYLKKGWIKGRKIKFD